MPGALHGPREANASVSIALSLEELTRASSVIAKVTPLERTSTWENGRIVTSTRLRVEEVYAGTAPGGARELRVRTLGGRVGDIGQLVEGEVVFAPNEPSIVFLTPLEGLSAEPKFVVAGRAQGHFHVQRDVHGREVVRVGAVGALVDRRVLPPLRGPGRRVTELDGSPVGVLALEVKRAWEVGHAK